MINLKISRWGDYPGLSGNVQLQSQWSLYEGHRRCDKGNRRKTSRYNDREEEWDGGGGARNTHTKTKRQRLEVVTLLSFKME
jgi:hypothetical protein